MTIQAPILPPFEVERGGLAACPACAVAPSAQSLAALAAGRGANIILSLPSAHCAACISTVETALLQEQGVKAARLNLTQRRVLIEADADVTPAQMIAALARAGYEALEMDAGLLSSTQTDKVSRDLAMRLGVAFFSMMNVMLLSVAVWSGGEGATRDLFHWISALIAIPTVAFSGRPFFASAARSLAAGRLGMDVPISLALILATAISLYETTQSGHHAYFDAAVMLCFFLLLGRYLDHRTRALARSAAEELTALEVPRATVVLDDSSEVVRPIGDIALGDIVRVRPGGRMPVDGVVIAGRSEIDRSLLTGETLPALAQVGTQVLAGEVNLTGQLDIAVQATGRDSALHRMADLVALAENAKTRYTSLAERAAAWYSPLVHLLSFSAFGVWMWITGGDLRYAINISAAVLIITCPCALGLAVPAVVTSASGRLFRAGLLIKNGTALERLAEVDCVVLDKTGTLTIGAPTPVDFDQHPAPVLSVAMALAGASSHPLALSLWAAAQARGIVPAEVSHIAEVAGYGIEGRYQGKSVRLGRAGWVGVQGLEVTATYLRWGDATHAFAFEDRLRQGVEKAMASFAAMGQTVYLVSGDSQGPVAAMAHKLGITRWRAGALPQDKAQLIADLSAQGHRVLMVGDGLNDTAALAGAHVSISPASALDAARVASDIVLLGADMGPIADALRIARQARRRILENFALSVGYNIIAVPLALVGLATPLAAALAMSLSSITVSFNALRLK